MSLLKRLVRRLSEFMLKGTEYHYDLHASDPASQKSLLLQYAAAPASFGLDDAGFKVFSQSDEDGRLLYIFSKIGMTNRLCVEIACGNGKECNSANLIVNHGWHGLLVDGSEKNIAEAQAFYETCRATYVWPPVVKRAFVTRENVNELIRSNGFEGEIDLLTVDIDGMDYWIWQAIVVVKPRVVVVEYVGWMGPERSCTVPYQADFDAFKYPTTNGAPDYAGASLMAMVKLARIKGYRLVGFNRHSFNAFFVRHDISHLALPEVDAGGGFSHPWLTRQIDRRYARVKDLPWIDV